MQLSQLYVSARDAPGPGETESGPRYFRSFTQPGERGSLSQLKAHFWCESAFAVCSRTFAV
eukprot:7389302-Prymnesium_polylepis.1